MNKIFYIMGKSSSGKDTIYNYLLGELNKNVLLLMPIVLHSTRPKREGEIEGITYFFETEESYQKMKKADKILEERTYHVLTKNGEETWRYFTSKKSIQIEKYNYLGVGTLESYKTLKAIYKDNIIPIYIDLDDGVRLMRAINREAKQKLPNYREVCRRFLSDSDDFSPEKLNEVGITSANTYSNNDDLGSICNTLTKVIISNI